MSIFEFWVQRYPQLSPAVWGLLSGRGMTRIWSEEASKRTPMQVLNHLPLSDWHRNVGLRLEYWRMQHQELNQTDICERLQVSPQKYKRVLQGTQPLLLLDLEHLSQTTGIPLSEWMPAELQKFFHH